MLCNSLHTTSGIPATRRADLVGPSHSTVGERLIDMLHYPIEQSLVEGFGHGVAGGHSLRNSARSGIQSTWTAAQKHILCKGLYC